MADNTTGFDALDVTAYNTSSAANSTSPAAAPSWQNAYGFLPNDLDFCILEIKLVLSALGIIYVGSHAALRRPPSALSPAVAKGGKKAKDRERENEEFAQGLMPSDAIMFPLLAGVLLVGLYYLIQWLQDPAILNKILRWYMSSMSIASLLTLYAHGMDLFTSFVFPKYWRGRNGALSKADQSTQSVYACDDVGKLLGGPGHLQNPCPAVPDFLVRSAKSRRALWELRGVLTRQWTFKFYLHNVTQGRCPIKFAHVMAFVLSVATALVYFSTSSTFLSNILGYGMCYGSFLLISPTDFLTSSLVLSGLFFYDIFMVFYTPYMVTVATTLDVPIKLTFEAASRKSILGLGDIVIPGMVMAWALRLDLWTHYLHKVKYEKTDLQIVETDSKSGQIVKRSDTQHREIKARYVDAKGSWGDRLWVRGLRAFSGRQQVPPELAASRFSKVYFNASMLGYLAGMLVTLAMLVVFKRGQPALLYLVPGVLGSICITALVRGEFKHLWTYTEDGSLDTFDEVVELDHNGKAGKRIGELHNGVVDRTKAKDGETKHAKDSTDVKHKKESKTIGDDAEAKTSSDKGLKSKTSQYVFYVSMEAPSEDAVAEKEHA